MNNIRVAKLKAFEFLCQNRLGVLSSISSDNIPGGSVVYYVVDGKSIYFITTKQSRKDKNLHTDNHAALTIFYEIPPLELQIEGITEIITDQAKKSYITKIYLEYSNKNRDTLNWPPILKLPNKDGFEFFKLTVNWYKFSDFRERTGVIIEGTAKDWE